MVIVSIDDKITESIPHPEVCFWKLYSIGTDRYATLDKMYNNINESKVKCDACQGRNLACDYWTNYKHVE